MTKTKDMTKTKCLVEEALWKCQCEKCKGRKGMIIDWTVKEVMHKIELELLTKIAGEKT